MNQIGARDHQEGFTLVELLVALALTAVIANFIVGGFNLVRRAAATTYARESAEEVDAAATQLRGLLARTMPVTTIDNADSIARLLFEGKTDAVTFVTLSEATAFQGGLMRVRLSWQDHPPLPGRPATLVVRAATFRSNPRLIFESEPVVLFRDVVGFSLRYFGVPELDKPRQWHSEWLRRDRLPIAVFVQIELAGRSDARRVIMQTTLRLAPTI